MAHRGLARPRPRLPQHGKRSPTVRHERAPHSIATLIRRAFRRTQSSFDRAALDGTQYLGHDLLFGSGPGERDAGLPTVNDPDSPAGVPHKIAAPLVVGIQHPAAPTASKQAGE